MAKLTTVGKNYSFSIRADDSRRFKEMFLDSDFAKSYKQSETKIKYSIQFEIAPFVKKLIKEQIHDIPFRFKFDERTTSQVKKQYVGFTQYWS